MPTSDEVQALLERVKACEFGDRELDAEIAKVVLGWVVYQDDPSFWRAGPKNLNFGLCRRLEFYTSSLDAIVALIDKELPGWGKEIFQGDQGTTVCLSLSLPLVRTKNVWGGTMPTMALALCAAFLSAKLAQMQEGE